MPKGREKMLGVKIERMEKEKAELLGALKALYGAVDPEVMLRAKTTIEKYDRRGSHFEIEEAS